MPPEKHNQLLRPSQSLLPLPLEDVFDSPAADFYTPTSTASSSSTISLPNLDHNTSPSSPPKMRIASRSHAKTPSYSSSRAPTRKASALHPRTSTPSISTVLPNFLNQKRCASCTVRIVYVSKPSASKPQRALVKWGIIPYFTTSGKPAEFVYHTFEQLSDLRPELIARWEDDQKRHRRESSNGPSSEWAHDKWRDSWVIEQLVYWVEFLNEWKFYREYYVFREELFEGEVPEVPSPACEHCRRRK